MRFRIERRDFLKQGTLAGAGLFWTLRAGAFDVERLFETADDSPLACVSGSFANGKFSGDEVTRPHQIFWDLENYIRSKGGRPKTFETADTVVVGGGMAGLLAAYGLRDLSPYLIEQAPRFGGNSQGEIFDGTSFSIGAAYLPTPEPGGEIEQLFRDLGIEKDYRIEGADEMRVLFRDQGLKNLFAGETAPAAKEAFLQVAKTLENVLENAYPDVPWLPDGALSKEQHRELDLMTAKDWLKKNLPGLPAHAEEYFQLYCWSSFGGSLEELSAAQFLNFVAAETGAVLAFPGGNSYVADALVKSLRATLPAARLNSASTVLEVKNVEGGVEVLFDDRAGKIRAVKAKTAIVAAPKYVARYIVKDLPSARADFWKGLTYRAYVVVNVLLKSKRTSPAFDVYRLQGAVPAMPSFGSRTDRSWTDVSFADWAKRDRGQASVLTLYKSYPFEGARNLITSDGAQSRIKGEVEKDVRAVTDLLGLPADSIAGMRMSRWGHALPLAKPGLASGPELEMLSAPHGRIAFANQDCYANPAFEACFASARAAEKFARKNLR